MELQTAKGTRDFSPEEKILRDNIVKVLKETCENYGFNPIETPLLEKYETLAAKFAAGEESDALKEIFKLKDQGNRKLGLRFDLTVPFSRYIAMNPNVKMPFKKYMTGEVFRDGPLKTGRYRQFTQFDPDIVGCKDMIADAEILALADSAFKKLGFDFFIEINNRKILDGILIDAGIKETDWFAVTIAIDKLKKIGKKGVEKELIGKGLKKDKVEFILNTLFSEKTNSATLKKLSDALKSEESRQGIEEMKELFDYLKELNVKTVVFNPSLARGLAYYTGPIFEVFLKKSSITGSIAGGGRYDKLIGNYLGRDEEIPATGISFGVDVIIEAMREKKMFDKKSVTKVYVIPIKTKKQSLKIAQQLRVAGINTDIDLMERGISKNLAFANSYGIPYVLIIGERELENGELSLKNMDSGQEEKLSIEKVISKLKN
ncbi:MAG: histidine--tRNA ligase [Nanoarchaeota archaeon]